MPQCIFCSKPTEEEIGGKRSICIGCMIRTKKIEFAHRKDIAEAVYPKEVRDALSRTTKFEPEKASAEDMERFKADVELLKKLVPV
jgi:hypothetical protein